LDLAPFRRRIRLLRTWRCAAIGGSAGAACAVLLAGMDYFDVLDATPRLLLITFGIGVLAGMARGLFENLPDNAIAQSVDRRGGLADRLTTAYEVPATDGGMASSMVDDARVHASALRPAALYPVRPGRWHGIMFGLVALAAFVFILGNTTWLRSAASKAEAAELNKAADTVQRVAMPELEAAKKADATPEDKELARQLNKFSNDLRKGRLNKQQAMLKANELAQQALKIQQSRSVSLAQSIQGAQTAMQKLEAMQNQAGLQKSDEAKLADQARALSSKIAAMQQSLDAAQAGKSKLSAAEKADLQKKLAAAQQQLKQIQLSQQAQAFMKELQSMPDFKEAQELLAKLAANAQAQQSGDPSQMTPEQMQQIADRLEAMAKKYNTDAKMRELAKEMLEAAKNARLAKNAGLGAGLMGAFGLGNGPSMGGLSLGMSHGPGAPSEDTWVGDHGTLSHSDKSSLLNVKFQDRQITNQIGKKGPETYTEVLGPSSPTGGSGVPYQAVLPKYEKSAESAIDKGDVPPQMRGKVRDYFDSLRQ